MNRKKFIQTAGLGAAGIVLSSSMALGFEPHPPLIKAIAFDAFPIFDPRPIFKTVNELFPEKGKQFSEIWKEKQFGYQWLRESANQYKNFWDVTKDALDYALTKCELSLSDQEKAMLMGKYMSLQVWPDVVQALEALQNQNLKLGFLSNMTREMLQKGIENSKTDHLFDFVISTDENRTFKPSPKAYQMGMDALNLKKEEILFVAFAGWDMAGSKWFGYPTYWVNRLNSPLDNLDAKPDGSGNDLIELVDFVKTNNHR